MDVGVAEPFPSRHSQTRQAITMAEAAWPETKTLMGAPQ